MITFGSTYKTPAIVDKISKNKELIPHNAAFVEMKPESMRDRVTLFMIINSLLKKKKFAKNIFMDFVLTNNGILNDANVKYFAVTEEQSDYKFVKPKNVLGLVEVASYSMSGGTVFVNYVQVLKNLIFNKFDHVGTCILDNIKRIYPDRNIVLDSVLEAIPFYEKNGFKVMDFSQDELPENCYANMRYSPTEQELSYL